MTVAEHKLWKNYLKTFPDRVYRQRPIDNFIIDFYCPKLKLVIEIYGESHYDENAQNYDQERTQILQSYGLQVIRFSNDDVLYNFTGVVDVLEAVQISHRCERRFV